MDPKSPGADAYVTKNSDLTGLKQQIEKCLATPGPPKKRESSRGGTPKQQSWNCDAVGHAFPQVTGRVWSQEVSPGKLLTLNYPGGARWPTISRFVFRGTGTSCIPIQYELCFRISTLLADNLGREDRAMRVKCLSCRQEMNMDHQAFSNFRGSLNCLNCRG